MIAQYEIFYTIHETKQNQPWKKTYSDITFLFGEDRYYLGLSIDRYSCMAQLGEPIPEEESEDPEIMEEPNDSTFWILEEYDLAPNPIDDIKKRLE